MIEECVDRISVLCDKFLNLLGEVCDKYINYIIENDDNWRGICLLLIGYAITVFIIGLAVAIPIVIIYRILRGF